MKSEVLLNLPFYRVKKFLRIRSRYVFTRRNQLRLRYVLSGMLCLLAATSSVLLFNNNTQNNIQIASNLPFEETSPFNDPENKMALVQRRFSRYAPDNPDQTNTTALITGVQEEKLEIGKGDTLAGILQKVGIETADAYKAVAAVKEHYDPRKLKPGQEIKVSFDPVNNGEKTPQFSELQIEIDPLTSVNLKRTGENEFESSILEKKPVRQTYASQAKIEDTLYGAAYKAGIPASVTAQALRIFSWDIDFQRDLRKGDVLDVMYDQMETPEGLYVKGGEILYARLLVNGQDIAIYRYETRDGDVDYYTAEGKSIRKALLQTPVDGARISSGFGMRKHPVLGYSKMHKGMDFAAPRGTPIYAAGDGTIEKAGPFSSYGNYVRIRHSGGLKTAYAHMNGFAKGIKAGGRVKQGQVIGYIGTTGRSTGPHLHYEVLQDGNQINPKSVKTQQGKTLSGKERVAFKAYIENLDRQYTALTRKTTLALGEKRAQTAIQ